MLPTYARDMKAKREAKGLTPTELAAKVGVSERTIRNWENGKGIPKGKRRETVNRVLGGVEWKAERQCKGCHSFSQVGCFITDRRKAADDFCDIEEEGR